MNSVLRLPKALGSTGQLVLWSWAKCERDLLGPGEVLLRASEANKRYAFTIPKALPSTYLKTILARDSIGSAVGFNTPLALISDQPPPANAPDRQPLEQLMQSVDPTGKVSFAALLQQHQDHARKFAGVAHLLGNEQKRALHKWLAANGGQGGAMDGYSVWELVGLWRTLDDKRDKLLLSLVFAQLSKRSIDTFPPHLVRELRDTYPSMDLFFCKLIVAEGRLQFEPEVTLELVAVKERKKETKGKKEKEKKAVASPKAEPALVEAEAQEMSLPDSAKLLTTWLIGKGGSLSLHKMEKFYLKYPEAGRVIQRHGVGNLTEWFIVEHNSRGQSLKIRRATPPSATPPPAPVSDEQVLSDLADFVQGKGGRIKPNELVDFFAVFPASKPRLHKRLKKWVGEHSARFELTSDYLTLK